MKKIKFPLEMKDGVKVRTIEELRENFDAEKLLMNYLNGKLMTWLKDRMYTSYAEQIENINSNDSDIMVKLCRILEVQANLDDMNLNIEGLEKEARKISKIKEYTDDSSILKRLKLVALDQKEFEHLLKQKENKIYLLGDKFDVSPDIQNCCIEGINTPMIHVESTEYINFEEKEVYFTKYSFDAEYKKIVEQKKYEDEHSGKKKRHEYVPSSKLDFRMSDEDRAGSERLFNIIQDNLVDFEFDPDIMSSKIKKILEDADLEDVFSIDKLGKHQHDILEDAELESVFDKFLDRIQ